MNVDELSKRVGRLRPGAAIVIDAEGAFDCEVDGLCAMDHGLEAAVRRARERYETAAREAVAR